MDKIIYHDGELHVFKSDVRRPNFERHHHTITTVADFKATLRAGPYAWPGGYPLILICDDCETLCFDCGRTQFRHIADAIQNDGPSAWRVRACVSHMEGPAEICAHCYKDIESAYGNPDNA